MDISVPSSVPPPPVMTVDADAMTTTAAAAAMGEAVIQAGMMGVSMKDVDTKRKRKHDMVEELI